VANRIIPYHTTAAAFAHNQIWCLLTPARGNGPRLLTMSGTGRQCGATYRREIGPATARRVKTQLDSGCAPCPECAARILSGGPVFGRLRKGGTARG
jgi:hypothetical protein